MDKNLFKNIEDLLGLQNNLKYQSAKRKYTNEGTSKKQKEKAKEKMFSIIIKKYSTNEMLKTYLSDADKAEIKVTIENYDNIDKLTDSCFYTLLYIINDKGQKAKMNYTYDFLILPALKETASNLEYTTVNNILKGINITTDMEIKKAKIITALEELFLETKTAIAKKDKANYKSNETQQKIEQTRNMLLGITLLLNSDENNFEIAKKVDEFLSSNIDLIRKVETKNMNEEANKSNTSGQNTSKIDEQKGQNTSLMVKKPQTYALQKVPVSATTTEPITKRNIIPFIVAGAMVVGIAVGAYFLGKTSNNKDNSNIPNNNTGVTDIIDNDTIQSEIEKDADVILANWSKLQTPYSREEIVELIKCLRGLESSISIEQADEMLLEMLNIAIYPAVNNAILKEQYYETTELDFSSLLSDNQRGIKAVENMENYLNGCLTDQENITEYATDAFEDQAFIIGEKNTIDGLSIQENTITDPGVRLVWSRLAIGTNAIAGTLGEDFSVEINGKIYTQNDINNTNVLENIAIDAKNDMGVASKSINMN